jgi:hypothetical protein
MPMLSVASEKYFNTLGLQYKHPGVRVRFLLADAQSLLGDEGAPPVAVPLPAAAMACAAKTSQSSGGSGNSSEVAQGSRQGMLAAPAGASAHGATGSSVWRFKKRQQQQQQEQQEQQQRQQQEQQQHQQQHQKQQQLQHQQQQQQQQFSTFGPASFDCVIDTFGLCSCDDPVQVWCSRLLLAPVGLQRWCMLCMLCDGSCRPLQMYPDSPHLPFVMMQAAAPSSSHAHPDTRCHCTCPCTPPPPHTHTRFPAVSVVLIVLLCL